MSFSTQTYLCSFKNNPDIQYIILNQATELISKIPITQILDSDITNRYIFENHNLFNKLVRLMGIPNQWNNLEVHTIIIQYSAFKLHVSLSKHFSTVSINAKSSSDKSSQYIKQIQQFRHEYTRQGYTLNLELLAPIPGIDLFNRYREYLE